MHFDDSLFESDSRQEKQVDASKIKYSAKRCELNWFTDSQCADGSTENSDFMLLKHRADLLYFQKRYEQATAQYEAVLSVVPTSNTVMCREASESLARCWLHLGQPERALEKAQLLVLPPHENDSSAWKLIADCQASIMDIGAQIISLQRCASQQRYQYNYWTSLAKAYGDLGQQYESQRTLQRAASTQGACSSLEHCCPTDWTELTSILETTVALFRPYFSWVSLRECAAKSPIKSHSEETVCEELSSIALRDYPTCPSSCMFSSQLLTVKDRYLDVIWGEVSSRHHLCVNFESTSSLCFLHSPFTMLMRRMVTASATVALLERLASDSRHLQFVREFVSSFLTMAQTSCLLWSRQLLLYFVRYSHSFVKDAHKSDLSRVETQLLCCHGDAKNFLEMYFNKNRVSEESQSKDEK